MTFDQAAVIHNELKDVTMDDIFSDNEDEDINRMDSNMANVQLQTPNRDQLTNQQQWSSSAPRQFNMNSILESAETQDPIFLLRLFYQRLFPYKLYHTWLSYDINTSKNFTHREFSFTLTNDIYIRYNSFADMDALKKEIERLQPVKIDIGAVYSVRPKDKKTVSEKAFRPLEKELVFDIDMTDYDEIRTCCSGGDVCRSCWEFMTIAVKVIDTCLRDDFGFEHLLWVYSGRRGVHCWVSDERARQLDNDSRKAIVGYLEVVKGGAEMARKVRLPSTLHPSLERSLEIIKPYFVPLILERQGVLDTKIQWEKMLNIISDEGTRNDLNESWSNDSSLTGREKWNELKDAVRDTTKSYDTTVRDILFQYLYPRLDDKVSININHLLKSPFCVHPKTQRVCVPIDPNNCESFDPLATPTLATLCKELNEYTPSSANDTERKMPDFKKTSLKPYIDIFEKFVNAMVLETQRVKREEASTSMEF
ncbi:uncharacterized protein BX664DRAFT_333431 [Halteromyces radiatus]|uniref:uncharacterized protein n=1 Tax=Halteromyces radiatus TaxID=101107 RepID=UPI00221E6A89|nr:uncharacterized protein BX664DRAFT_333431 [Halteromyces radiatus]KAI8089598.1 hypothetical protein BX664DRAFT_333431 [Halteromyces radiatus]